MFFPVQLAVGVTVGLILNDDITPRGVRELSWHVHALTAVLHRVVVIGIKCRLRFCFLPDR